jgi:hypothetical protein
VPPSPGALLLRGPRSQLARVLANNDPQDAGRMGHNHIEDAIRRGGCAFQHASGKTCWQFYDEELGLSQRFEEMMEVVSRDEDATMATDYPGWSRARWGQGGRCAWDEEGLRIAIGS